MKGLLLGAGRMGLRHLQGLLGRASEVCIIDANPDALAVAKALAGDRIKLIAVTSLDQAATHGPYDFAIMAETAAGRLERFQQVLGMGLTRVLVEKPVEQSRARTRALLKAAENAGARVWSNHYRRGLSGFAPLVGGGPYVFSVSSGAMGLGCNGIHWLDFTLYLTGSSHGELLFGEVDSTPILSGRGPQFRDYGGRGLFAFDDGSRLFLSCCADSSAPTAFSIIGAHRHWLVDQLADKALLHDRDPACEKPNYLYGADYQTRAVDGIESVELWVETADWLDALLENREVRQPLLSAVMPAYELLFDLLERSGEAHFSFT